jgi:hypothetical protein
VAADTVWLPGLRVLVVNVAVPPTSVTGEPGVPSMVKVTVPVGVTAQVTVAVKVTGWPGADGLADEVSVVPAPAMVTICTSEVGAVEAQLLSPL